MEEQLILWAYHHHSHKKDHEVCYGCGGGKLVLVPELDSSQQVSCYSFSLAQLPKPNHHYMQAKINLGHTHMKNKFQLDKELKHSSLRALAQERSGVLSIQTKIPNSQSIQSQRKDTLKSSAPLPSMCRRSSSSKQSLLISFIFTESIWLHSADSQLGKAELEEG